MARNSNPKIASKTLASNKPATDAVGTRAKPKEKEYEVVSDVDEVVQSPLYHINYLMHEFKDLSPNAADHFVWRFYPAAKDGPVYIDRPETPRQMKLCESKAKVMAKANKKYLVYRPGDDQKFDEYKEQYYEDL